MRLKKVTFLTSLLLFFIASCGTKDKKVPQETSSQINISAKDTVSVEVVNKVEEIEKDTFRLNEENAIDFFFEYAKNSKENRVRLTT
ncbi:MAG: peptidylprolyl isomerase, partial [Bacteroidota bacterium]